MAITIRGLSGDSDVVPIPIGSNKASGDGAQGPPGPPGPGVAPGGTAGQVLSKVDATDYNTIWTDAPAGGGGGATDLDGLTDVDTTTTAPVSGNVLTYNGIVWTPAAGTPGPPGEDGAPGSPGAAGPGVAAGGTAGQILSKVDAADFNTVWVDAPSGGGGASDLDDLTDVDITTTPPASGNVLTYDGTVWKPAAPAGGGSVDWNNVPAPVTIPSPASPLSKAPLTIHSRYSDPTYGAALGASIAFHSNVTGTVPAQPTALLAATSSGMEFRAGAGTASPSMVFKYDTTSVLSMKYIGLGNNAATLKFSGPGYYDTILQADAVSAGILKLNGKVIQVAAARADGSEIGLQELVDEVAALRAEIAELRAGRG